QPVAGIYRRERLAAAGRHLDQRAGVVLGQRPLQVLDRSLLDRPQLRGVERGQGFQLAAHLSVKAHEAEQLLGAMEGEDFPAAGIGLQQVRELRDGAGALVRERQGIFVGGNGGRQSTAVNIFEGRRNLLWVKDLKQLITYCKSNISSMKIIGYIVNANLIVILGDMDKDRATPDRPDNPLSKCRHASNDLHGSGFGTAPEEPARIDRASGESKKTRRR